MRLPPVAVLELTARCNHTCIFCSCPWEYDAAYKNKELPVQEWKDVIDLYARLGATQVTFTGGEPTLYDGVFQLIEHAAKCHLTVGLITNGRNANEDFLRRLKEYGVGLSISVPGIQTFARHTGVDNVRHVLELFSLCKKHGIDSTANIAVTKINLSELYENIAYPVLYGADYVLLNRFLPGGRGMKNREFLLNNQEINQMLDVAEEVLARAGVYGHVGTELPMCIVRHPEKYRHLQVSHMCAAGKDFFVTDPSGYIKVCNHSPQRICSWRDADKLDTYEYWNTFSCSKYIPAMCNDCNKRDMCDGGCREAAHVNYGSVSANDPCFSDANGVPYPTQK